MHPDCLLLNADYSPLRIINWQRALVWSMRYSNDSIYSIEIVDFYKNGFVQGVNNKKFPIPSVAKTKEYFRSNSQKLTFSRKNIFLRDDHTCQYCGTKFDEKNLTYDHVIPKSKWLNHKRSSATTWTNIVTACTQCNRKKGNKTPSQANMPLKKLPAFPAKTLKYLPVVRHLNKIRHRIPPEWKIYLPESYYL